MTFKKGFYIGLVIGLVAVIIGVLYVNKVSGAIENIETVNLAELSLQDLDGNEVNISDYGKDKHLLVNFWATWCKPCIEEFPILDKTQKLVENDFEFIVISEEPAKKIKNFITKENYKFTYLKIDKLPLGIRSLPQTFILNKKLETKKYFSGAIEEEPAKIATSLKRWVLE